MLPFHVQKLYQAMLGHRHVQVDICTSLRCILYVSSLHSHRQQRSDHRTRCGAPLGFAPTAPLCLEPGTYSRARFSSPSFPHMRRIYLADHYRIRVWRAHTRCSKVNQQNVSRYRCPARSTGPQTHTTSNGQGFAWGKKRDISEHSGRYLNFA